MRTVGQNENQRYCTNTRRIVSQGFRRRDAHTVNDFSCKVAGNPFEGLERTEEKLNIEDEITTKEDCGPEIQVMTSGERPQRHHYID